MTADLLLYLNTAYDGCTLTLCKDGKSVAKATLEGRYGQSEHLVPLIDRLYEDAGLDIRQTSVVAVITGPGSFTGIRVGLAAAIAMKAVLKCPCYGIDAFSAYKMRADRLGLSYPRLCLVESFRDDYFGELSLNADEKPLQKTMSTEEIDGYIAKYNPVILGNAAIRYQNLVDNQYNLEYMLEAEDIAAYLPAKQNDDLKQSVSLQPFYLRDADVSISKKQMRSIQVSE